MFYVDTPSRPLYYSGHFIRPLWWRLDAARSQMHPAHRHRQRLHAHRLVIRARPRASHRHANRHRNTQWWREK